MTEWLRLILMIFYAPLRGMREVRDRGPLGAAVVCAYVVQVVYILLIHFLAGDRSILRAGPGSVVGVLFHGVAPILTVAIVIVPMLILIANLFDRRGSFSVVLQQEYGSLGSLAFYVVTGVSLVSILIAIFFHFSGIQAAYVADVAQYQDSEQMRNMAQLYRLTADQIAQVKGQLSDQIYVSMILFETVRIPLLAIGGLVSVKEVFRVSVFRSLQ